MAIMTKRALTLCLVLLMVLVVFVAPVAAVTLQIDLDKTYEFKKANLSTMYTTDLADPSVSKVEFVSTAGDDSDVQVIQQPTINNIRRIFTSTTGTFKNNTLTVVGDADSTVSYLTRPEYRIYTQFTVPTFKVTAPGETGNPVILKYNESWEKEDTSSISSIILSSDKRWLYKVDGILYEDETGYFASNFPTYDEDDLPFTLNQNLVDLNPFLATSTRSKTVALNPARQVQTGKYFAGAMSYDGSTNSTTIYALAPVVVLKEKTPIVWTDNNGQKTLPASYVKGQDGDVTLSFAGSNHDVPTAVGYVFINSGSAYELNVSINTEKLTETANNRWSTLASNAAIVELLYKSITNDVGDAYTYNLTAVGKQTPPSANLYSTIAITPGYGISNNATGATVTIPETDFASLNAGTYYVYLMGVNDDKDVVALWQSVVSVKSSSPNPPTIASIMPNTGLKNSTTNFTITGTNFPTDLGTSGVTVNLTKITNDTITSTIYSVTSTKIEGAFNIPATANLTTNGYDLVLTTADFGQTIKEKAYTVKANQQPGVSMVSPVTAYINTTYNFTITGTNFQTGEGQTYVNFTFGNYYNRANTTLIAVTPTKIVGYMTIIGNESTLAGKWDVNVKTEEGGLSATKTQALTVSALPKAVITTVTPTTKWYRNSTVSYVITGKNFQPGMTTVIFMNQSTEALVNNTIVYNVSSTQIDGTFQVPVNASLGNKYRIDVVTVDSGTNGTKSGAFTVDKVGTPTFGSISPAKGSKNTTVNFTMTGTNYQTGADNTRMRIYEDVMDTELDVTIISITPTKITGSVQITDDSFAGNYYGEVYTVDGGTGTKSGAFTVEFAGMPTVAQVSPTSAYRNSTVQFTVTGTNFQPGLTNATYRNQTTQKTLNSTDGVDINSVTTTKLIGNITIPATAPTGFYRLDVMTADGGTANKVNALKVLPVLAPQIGTLTPTSGAKGTTVAFTLLGSNFMTPEQTSIRVVDDSSGTELATSIISMTDKKVIGSFIIPANAPQAKYKLEVKTTDGGTVTKYEAFTVNARKVPTIGTITPNTGFKNSTVSYTLKGADFVDGATIVRLRATGSTINATVDTVSSDAKTITGSFFIGANNATGAYRLDVFTADGGFSSKTGAFTVKDNVKAQVTSISPLKGYQNTTVAFTIKGTGFTPDATNVWLLNQSASDPINPIVSITPTLFSVTSTEIIGSMDIPQNATLKQWKINVSTVDGGNSTKLAAFTVESLPVPTITAVSPSTARAGTNASFTITGKNFLTKGATNVTFTKAESAPLYADLKSVSSTSLYGIVSPPAADGAGSWTVTVKTINGGAATKVNAITFV